MLRLVKIFLLTFFCVSGYISAQVNSSDRYLEIRGHAELDMEPLSRATVNVFEGSNKVQTLQAGSDGSFAVKLQMNKQYTIEVAKEGLVSKRISFNTEIPDEEIGTWMNEFSIGLIKYCDGVDYSALDDPVDQVTFDAKKREFMSDKAYVNRMRSRIESVYAGYERCMLDKYEQAVRKGDQHMAAKNFKEAITAYKEALNVYSDEEYPAKKIAEANVQLNRQQGNEEIYKSAVAEADALASQQRYEEALVKYQRAAALNSQESYPRQKISEMETALARQQSEQNAFREKEDRYNKALAQASVAYTRKDYQTARQFYQEALTVKPEESLPKTRMKEIEEIIARKEAEDAKVAAVNNSYARAIARGDSLVKLKKYDEAKQQFAAASTIKPAEGLPRSKIAEVDRIAENEIKAAENAKREALDKQYRELIALADQQFREKKYNEAKINYTKALEMKPSEAYPIQRIKAVDNAVANEQATLQREKEEGYNTAITAANNALAKNQFQVAKASFQQALSFKSDDVFAKSKLSEIDGLAQEYERQKVREEESEKQYRAYISEADALYQRKEWEPARAAFTNALTIKPGDEYAQQRITGIDNSVAAEEAAKLRAAEESYKAAIGAANSAIVRQSYTQAKEYLQEALNLKPDDAFAKSKMQEVDELIELQRKVLEQEQLAMSLYNEHIEQADKYYAEGDLTSARSSYVNALQVKQGDLYATKQISAVDKAIAEKEAEQLRQIENSYADAMSLGTASLQKKEYNTAKGAFESALSIKPKDITAKSKLAETQQLLAREEQRIASEQAARERYDEYIRTADQYFSQRDYTNARSSYEQAMQIFPGESYPRTKLNEISAALNKQEQDAAQVRANEHAYQVAITSAEKYFNAKDYYRARDEYNRALQLKPEEELPKIKLAETEELIRSKEQAQADAKARTEAYTAAINAGNAFFEKKEYEEARTSYTTALQNMPGDLLAADQIKKIDHLMAEVEKQRQAESARQSAYDEMIKRADKSFDEGQYAVSKVAYQDALAIMPNSSYARQRVSRIDAILRARDQQVSTGTSQMGSEPAITAVHLGELDFRTESEKQKYLDELLKNYPDGITLEKYDEKYKETFRYIIIRDNQAQEFRQVKFKTFNGAEYSFNGKPITQQYFLSQVKVREGESFNEINIQ